MVRQKRHETNYDTLLEKVESEKQKTDIDLDDMPLETLGDYLRYNAKARKMNKKLKICRYPIKQCPIEKHPKERIQFMRKDQPKNPLHVYLYNEMIDFKDELIPGRVYDLPLCIVDYLASKGYPIWERIINQDGSEDTVKVAMDPRFALRTIYESNEYRQTA
jgi:hypothetical protein